MTLTLDFSSLADGSDERLGGALFPKFADVEDSVSSEPLQRVEFPVPDARTAIQLATAFMSKGYTIFRGQNADWKLNPTLHRVGTDKQSALERFRSFADWVQRQPELAELHGNYDATIAVAQHYGFKTPFLDFTRDPAVAAYFALDSCRTSQRRLPGSAAIACINPEQAQESWRPYNQPRLQQGEPPLIRLVDINVMNLWRLQAQAGLFLDVHVDDVLFHDITPVVYILFPATDQPVGTRFPEIYPSNKSPLEAVLEQFFAEERARAVLDEKARQWTDRGADATAMWQAANAERRNLFLGGIFPADTPTWVEVDRSLWLSSPRVDLDDEFGYPQIEIPVDAKQTSSRIWQVARANILSQVDRWRSRGIVKWQTTFSNTSSAHALERANESHSIDKMAINTALSHMYDGMRWLPYTEEQIAQALASYLCLVAKRIEYEKQWGPIVEIELAAGLVTSRCMVGVLPLRQAFRNDIQQYLTPEFRDKLSVVGYCLVVDALPYPRKLFEFPHLVDLFATQIIPSQFASSLSPSSVIFNPAKLDLLCLTDIPLQQDN